MKESQQLSFEDMEDMRIIEAVLFMAPEPMQASDFIAYLPHRNEIDVASLLSRLSSDYQGRGVELFRAGQTYAFRTAGDLGEKLTAERIEHKKLSRAAMEVLSVIAYHQPVTRAEIEAIRGVATGKGTLDQLLEMGWIKTGRRREAPGRPVTWISTPAFLDHFGLASIVDLPGLDELKAAGLLDRRPAANVMNEITGELFDDDDGSSDAADHGDDEAA